MFTKKKRFLLASTSCRKASVKREMNVCIDILIPQKRELKIALTMIEAFVD